MKFKNLNESLVSEDKYKQFILSMMGETGGGKVFTAAISPDDEISEAPYEEKAFSSFISAREWCEKTLKSYNSKTVEPIAYIVRSNIDNIETNVCLCFNGKMWYFFN